MSSRGDLAGSLLRSLGETATKSSEGVLLCISPGVFCIFQDLVDYFLSGHGPADLGVRTELCYQSRVSTLHSSLIVNFACSLIAINFACSLIANHFR